MTESMGGKMIYRLASRFSLLILAFAIVVLALPATAFGETITPDGTASASLPTIQSDQADYPPGATVTLTGSNWQPGEAVHITVNDDQGQTWSRDADVSADASGNITDQFQLPDWFVATYKVTATGAQSGAATTTFTDGNLSFNKGLNATGGYTETYTLYSGSTSCKSGNGVTSATGTATVTNNGNISVAVNSTQSLKLGAVSNGP